MKHLVIGLGEVGSAIQAVLECDGIDKDQAVVDEFSYDMVMLEGLLGVNALLEDSQDTAQGE